MTGRAAGVNVAAARATSNMTGKTAVAFAAGGAEMRTTSIMIVSAGFAEENGTSGLTASAASVTTSASTRENAWPRFGKRNPRLLTIACGKYAGSVGWC